MYSYDFYSLGLALNSQSLQTTPNPPHHLSSSQRHSRCPERPTSAYSASGRIQKLSPRSSSRISAYPASASSSPNRLRTSASMSRPFHPTHPAARSVPHSHHPVQASLSHAYRSAQSQASVQQIRQMQQMQLAAQQQLHMQSQMLPCRYPEPPSTNQQYMPSSGHWPSQACYSQPHPPTASSNQWSFYADSQLSRNDASDFQMFPWQQPAPLSGTLLAGSTPAAAPQKPIEPELIGLGLYDTSSKEPSALMSTYSPGKGLKLEESWEPSTHEDEDDDDDDDDEPDANAVPDLEDEDKDRSQDDTQAEYSPLDNMPDDFSSLNNHIPATNPTQYPMAGQFYPSQTQPINPYYYRTNHATYNSTSFRMGL